MTEYKSMYLRLFNAVTDALALLQRDNTVGALLLLIEAQREVEETYISADID